MAVQAVPLASVLVARFVTGTDAEGNPILRARRWSKVKPAAPDQGVYNAAQAMAGLQVHTLAAIERQLTSELIEV
jgi:hypothetical protein